MGNQEQIIKPQDHSHIEVHQENEKKQTLQSALDLASADGNISLDEIDALKKKFAGENAMIDAWLEKNKSQISSETQQKLEEMRKTSEKEIKTQKNAAIDYNKTHLTQEQILMIQKYLGIPETGEIDINFITEVKKYQKHHHLERDGKVGKKTLHMMKHKHTKKSQKPIASMKSENIHAGDGEKTGSEENISQTISGIDYTDMKTSIQDFNGNEKKFIFPQGVSYFGDNFSSDLQAGFAIRKGREDYRVIVTPDGKFTTLQTTGIEYQDILQKAKIIKTGMIAMKNNQFDFSQVL